MTTSENRATENLTLVLDEPNKQVRYEWETVAYRELEGPSPEQRVTSVRVVLGPKWVFEWAV